MPDFALFTPSSVPSPDATDGVIAVHTTSDISAEDSGN